MSHLITGSLTGKMDAYNTVVINIQLMYIHEVTSSVMLHSMATKQP